MSPSLISESALSISTKRSSAFCASARLRSPSSRSQPLKTFSRSPSVLPNSRKRGSLACARLKSEKCVRVDVTAVSSRAR